MDRNLVPGRVALLSLHSSPYAALGGVDAGGMNLYVRRLAAELSRMGVAVDIFTRRTASEVAEITEIEAGARLIQIRAGPARWLPRSALPMHLAEMVAQLRMFMQHKREEYDILHSHYWLSGLAAVRYRSTTGDDIPLVHMFHTLSRVKEHYLGSSDKNDAALRFDGERCVLRRADFVVGGTPCEVQDMERFYGWRPARYAVIPPGVDFDQFYPRPRDEARLLLGIKAKRVVLFVGRADRLKGLETLLRAVAALAPTVRPGLKLLVVGAEPARGSSESRRLRRLVSQLGLEDTVDLAGKVDHDVLPIYYSAADILALPSAYESFGMAALEAMACATPVLAFNVGGLSTLVQPGRTGFLAPQGDTDAYRALLEEALTQRDGWAMGLRARSSVLQYTWESTAERTLQAYAELLAERSSQVRFLPAAR